MADGGEDAILAALSRVDELGRLGLPAERIALLMSDEGAVVPGGGRWDGDRVEQILRLFASARREASDDGDDDVAAVAARTAEVPIVRDEGPRPPASRPATPSTTADAGPPATVDGLPPVVVADAEPDRRRPLGAVRLGAITLAMAGLGAAGFLAIDAAVGGGRSGSELIGDVATPTTGSAPTSTTEAPDPADTMAIRIETDAPAPVGPDGLVPATATIRVDGRLHVEGAFTTQGAADAFVEEAAEVFGRENIVESYVVDSAAPKPQVSDVSLDKPVLFESGTAVIHPDYIPFLEACAGVLALNPHIVMSVTGHTDDVGDEAFNLELSRRRAQAIVDFYREREIGDDQLLALGLGEASPVGDNETEEGREANRRAMLQLLNVVGDEAADLG